MSDELGESQIRPMSYRLLMFIMIIYDIFYTMAIEREGDIYILRILLLLFLLINCIYIYNVNPGLINP